MENVKLRNEEGAEGSYVDNPGARARSEPEPYAWNKGHVRGQRSKDHAGAAGIPDIYIIRKSVEQSSMPQCAEYCVLSFPPSPPPSPRLQLVD